MSTLKGDIVNAAYSRARISGLTRIPSPGELDTALDRLEDMMAAWLTWNIDVGYNFEEGPNTGTPHGVDRAYLGGIKSNLALLLLTDFGKQIPQALMLEANASFSQLLAGAVKPSQVPYPARMPIGSGRRWPRANRFYTNDSPIKEDYSAIQLFTGDIRDLQESLQYAIRTDNAETVSSYSISAETGITIVSSSLASPIVSFRVKAGDAVKDRVIVTIVAVTSLGQQITKQVYFKIEDTDA